MDNEDRKNPSKKNWQPIVKPSNVIFFLNNELVKLIHSNKANNICILYNYITDKEQSMLYSDFKKHRKKAYTVKNTLMIFRRSRVHLERLITKGIVMPPTGATVGGKRQWRSMSYYSEDDLFKIRDGLASIHSGRPRKDGKVTPRKDVLTERELRSLIGEAIMLYTKNKDGEFIPVWAEETW